jgi:hypothetical protein
MKGLNMADRLVTVATFTNGPDAHVARILLSKSSINSVVVGEGLLMAAPQVGLPEVELQVLHSQAEKALEILQSQ